MVASRSEVEWDETERGWFLALDAYRASLCPLCGGPRDECMGADAEFAYEGTLPIRCHKTTAIRREQKKRQDKPGEHDDALLWGAQRKQNT